MYRKQFSKYLLVLRGLTSNSEVAHVEAGTPYDWVKNKEETGITSNRSTYIKPILEKNELRVQQKWHLYYITMMSAREWEWEVCLLDGLGLS